MWCISISTLLNSSLQTAHLFVSFIACSLKDGPLNLPCSQEISCDWDSFKTLYVLKICIGAKHPSCVSTAQRSHLILVCSAFVQVLVLFVIILLIQSFFHTFVGLPIRRIFETFAAGDEELIYQFLQQDLLYSFLSASLYISLFFWKWTWYKIN